MALTTVEYIYTGQASFPLPFPLGILSREHVTVQVNGALDGSGDPLEYTNLTWLSNSELSVNGLSAGDVVLISRTVPKLELITSFENNANVTHSNLDNQAKQVMMIYHELIDGRAIVDPTTTDLTEEEVTALIEESVAALLEAGPYTVSPLRVYDPVITRTAIDAGTGFYRHVPAIDGWDTNLTAAYTYNNTSVHESDPGQQVGIKRSTDLGTTFGELNAEWTTSTWANNPVSPEPTIMGEAFVLYNPSIAEEWAVFVGRAPEQSAYFSRRSVSSSANKWDNYRVFWTDDDEQVPTFRSTNLTGAAPATLKSTYTIGAVTAFAPIFGRPYKDEVDNRVVIPMVLLNGFGAQHWGTVIYSDNDGITWKQGGLIPLGAAGSSSVWEMHITRTANNLWRMQMRDIGGANDDGNHQIAESADLLSWTPWSREDLGVHTNRIIHRRFRKDLFMGTGVTHPGNRNALEVFMSTDGQSYAFGKTIADEVDGVDFVHYSDLCAIGNRVYVAWTKGPTAGPAPNEVFLAAFDLPPEGQRSALPSSRNAVLANDLSRVPSVNGEEMVIPPRALAGVAVDAESISTLSFKVDQAPAADGFLIAAIGDYGVTDLKRAARVTLDTDLTLRVNGVATRAINVNEYSFVQVALDAPNRSAVIDGVPVPAGKTPRITLGDSDDSASNDVVTMTFDFSRTTSTQLRNSSVLKGLMDSSKLRREETPWLDFLSWNAPISRLSIAGEYYSDTRGLAADAILGLSQDAGNRGRLTYSRDSKLVSEIASETTGDLTFYAQKSDGAGGFVANGSGGFTLSEYLVLSPTVGVRVKEALRLEGPLILQFGFVGVSSSKLVKPTRTRMRVTIGGGLTTATINNIDAGTDGQVVVLELNDVTQTLNVTEAGNIVLGGSTISMTGGRALKLRYRLDENKWFKDL